MKRVPFICLLLIFIICSCSSFKEHNSFSSDDREIKQTIMDYTRIIIDNHYKLNFTPKESKSLSLSDTMAQKQKRRWQVENMQRL